MGLVQMRTPNGSYSDVDEVLVDEYVAAGWTRTGDLSEFAGLGVVAYNPDGTVLLETGETALYTPVTSPGSENPGGSGGGGGGGSTNAGKKFTIGQGLDTAKALFSFFEDDLLNEYAKNWAKYGDAKVAIGLTRQSATWEKYFSYLKRDDGTLIMSEIDALSNIESYKATLGEYDIEDTSMFKKQFEQLIVNAVDPIEFEERLSLVYNEIIDDIPEVQRLFAEQYGIEATRSAIFGALINKDVEDGLLSNQITTLQMQAEGTSRGFSTSYERAKNLRTRGLNRETARKLYSSAGQTIANVSSMGRDLSVYELEEAALGDQRFINRLQRYESEYMSKHGMRLGARRKDGKVTGLIE
jgi:hypothetical protein